MRPDFLTVVERCQAPGRSENGAGVVVKQQNIFVRKIPKRSDQSPPFVSMLEAFLVPWGDTVSLCWVLVRPVF